MSYEKDISWVDSAAAKRIVNRCVKLFCVNQPKLIAVIFDRGGGVHPPYSPPPPSELGRGDEAGVCTGEYNVSSSEQDLISTWPQPNLCDMYELN